MISLFFYEFGSFRLDPRKRRLWREGEDVAIKPKVFDTLLVLVENRGQVVEKDELMRRIWPDAVVEENSLSKNISDLRKLLGESAADRRYIATVPGRGYQFVAEVNKWQVEEPSLIVKKKSISQITIEEDQPGEENLEPDAAPKGADISELFAPPPLALPAPVRHFSIKSRWTLAIGGGILALAALVALGLSFRRQPPTTADQVRSLAVLPFQFLNPADDEGMLGLGLADALITRLGATGMIAVRSTNAVQQYASAGRNLSEIGRKLEVEAVLDGRVQRAGDQLRLTVQLLRAQDGVQLWGGSFDEQFTNVLTVQKTISEQVARALMIKLSAEQQRRLKKDYTADTAAFEAYARGRYFWGKQTRESVAKALDYFQQAIEIDPAYALAWTGIADSYVTLGIPVAMMGVAPQSEAINKARAAAERAVQLDESLPEAHVAMGAVFIILNDAAAHREFERALELNPNLAAAHHYYGWCLLGDGRPEEALPKLARARELDPLSVLINANVGTALYRLRRDDEADLQLRKTLEMDANFVRAHWALGLVYEQQGRFDEAVAELQKAEQLSGGGAVAVSALGHVYAITGRRAEAEHKLARLLALHERNLASPYYIAAVYAGLGDKEQAFAWLEKIRGTGSVSVLKMDRHFDPLRDDPRFAGLLQR